MSTDVETPAPAPAGDPVRGLARAVRGATRISTRRPWLTVLLWIVLVAGLVAAGAASGTRSLTPAELGLGDSGRADQLVRDAGLEPPQRETVLVRTDDAARTGRLVAGLERSLAVLPQVTDVSSTPADDGRAVALDVVLAEGDTGAATGPVAEAVAQARRGDPAATVRQTGAESIDQAIDDVVAEDLRRAELLSVPITLLILVLAFGSLVAATVPVVLGVTAVAGAMGAIGLISHVIPSGDTTGALVVLIGLAVGVDYSLFSVRREREERRRGATLEQALEAAAASVGRAVLISGVTVMIALAGLALTGVPDFTSMAVGTVVVVAIAVLGSLTVLPAMLALLGDRIEAGRLGLPGAKGRRARRLAADSARPTRWGRIADRVTTHPVVALAAAVVLLGGLAVPALGIRLGDGDVEALPADLPAVQAAQLLEETFPRAPWSAGLVVTGAGLDSPTARAGLAELGRRAVVVTGGLGEADVTVAPDGRTGVVWAPMADRGSEGDRETVERLRAELTPAGVVPGAARMLVTGSAAGDADFAVAVERALPLVVGFVLGLALLLLLAAFRSLRLALAVIALNLLSVCAALGVLVAVFQGSWAEGLLGFTSTGTITTWMPLVSFVILFGLSMDYSVLLLERIREARLAGRSPREAAAEGLTATAGTVTAAAVVMVAVFAIFATLRLLSMKQIGIGLSTAVLLDATVVRAVALPAAVTLLGERAFGRARPSRRRRGAWDDERMVSRSDG